MIADVLGQPMKGEASTAPRKEKKPLRWMHIELIYIYIYRAPHPLKGPDYRAAGPP